MSLPSTRFPRHFSTTAGEAPQAPAPEKVSLKNALRKFYMIVHPDRLTGHPKEQKTNDDSFRSLNSYLDIYKNERATDEDLAQEHSVKFFVPKKNGEAGFTIAKSDLKQPPRGSSQQARERLIHDSLVSLFKSCGLDIDVDVSGYGAPAGASTGASGASGAVADPPIFKALSNLAAHLGAFTKKNSPAGKKLAQLQTQHQQAVDALLKKITDKHNTSVLLDFPQFYFKSAIERSQSVTTQLKKVEAALDRLSQQGTPIAKLTSQGKPQLVLSTKKMGWAHTGHLYIDGDLSVDDLVAFFTEVSPSGLTAIKEYATKRYNRESALKSALDLASVTSEHNVGTSEIYLELLDTIGADIAKNSSKWLLPQVARGKVHLRFTNGLSADHIPLDGSTASLLLPVDTPVDRVRAFVAENAGEAAKRFQRLEAGLKTLKVMLGVKSITYQPGMDVDHLKEGLEKLAQIADQIRPFLNNVNLVLAKQYGVNEDNQQIMIKWNFYL